MPSSVKRRDERLELRVTPAAKAMLRRAAEVENKTVSSFVLDKGLEAAAETLADRHEFRLDAKLYDAFLAALDAPAKARPRLEKLLTTRSVLE
ncbi:MAG: type II toxin-antitoxin system TacA family antitoxin [Steroidobacteraceae bacterium]